MRKRQRTELRKRQRTELRKSLRKGQHMNHYQRNAEGVMVSPARRQFSYSDGVQAEQRIARIISQASNRSVFSPQLLQAATDWVAKYHLSPQRVNLLRPLQHLFQDRAVLELGAGCGILTRYMAEHAKRIIALEGSEVRAAITATRCQDLENVVVINDTIQDLQLQQKFDLVTLIGVLEYARLYDSQSESFGTSPELAILQKVREFLKPGGSLILAIENKVGLKYFAGAKEDHLGRPFFGVHDLYNRKTVVTFGRFELEALLRQAGFTTLTQLIPLPDYKLPVTILHPPIFDKSLPSINAYPLLINSVTYDNQPPSKKSFSLEAAYKTVLENNLLPDLCNSLYYIASGPSDSPNSPGSSDQGAPNPLDPEILASHYGGQRYKEFAQETLFIRKGSKLYVKKRRLHDDCPNKTDLLLNTLPPNSAACPAADSAASTNSEYNPSPTLYEKLMPIINTPGWTLADLAAWSAPWIAHLRSLAMEGNLPAACLDMTPTNFFVDEDGKLLAFDCEWSPADGSNIPLTYIAMRGLFNTLNGCSNVAPPAKDVPVSLIQLIAKLLALHNITIQNADVKFFLYKYFEFCKAATGIQLNIEELGNANLTIRELA